MPEILIEALVVMMVALGGTAAITMIMRARHLYGWPERRGRPFGPNEEDIKLAALKSHEKLSLEKLDVLKQAIAMGWDDAQLQALDARLEQLVGKGEVERIASGALPSSDIESIVLSPSQELDRIKRTIE